MTAEQKTKLIRSAKSWIGTTGKQLEWEECEPRLKEAFDRADFAPTFRQRLELFEWWQHFHFEEASV